MDRYHWRITWVPDDDREAEESQDVTGTVAHAESVADAGPPSEYAVRESVIERRGAANIPGERPETRSERTT